MTSGDPRRETIAAAMWRAEADSAPLSVKEARTPEAFREQAMGTRFRWLRLADAALAADAARVLSADVAGLVERLRIVGEALVGSQACEIVADAMHALEALAARAETAEAEVERLDQARRDIIDASGQQCGCGYDRPDDVCLGHLPMVNALKARAEKAEAERDALTAALREARGYVADWRADDGLPSTTVAAALARIDALLEGRT